MTNVLPKIFFGLAALAIGMTAPSVAATEKVRIGHAYLVAGHGYMMAAVDRGYFKAEGLDPEVLTVSGGIATSALMSGNLDVSTSGSSSVTAILQGAHLKVVMVGQDRSDWQLWASSPQYATLQDLKGRQIGVISRGDTGEVAVRYLLRQSGLPQDFVSFTPLGNGGGRLAAISGASLPASLLLWIEVEQLKTMPSFKNARLVSNLTQAVQMVYGGVALTDDTIKNRPNFAMKIVRALYKGAEWCRAHHKQGIQMVARWTKSTPEDAAVDYQHYMETMTADSTVSRKLQKAEIDLRGEMIGMPKAKLPDPSAVFDFSIVQRVAANLKAQHWQPNP